MALGSHLSELNAVIETLTKGPEQVANFGSGLDIQISLHFHCGLKRGAKCLLSEKFTSRETWIVSLPMALFTSMSHQPSRLTPEYDFIGPSHRNMPLIFDRKTLDVNTVGVRARRLCGQFGWPLQDFLSMTGLPRQALCCFRVDANIQ